MITSITKGESRRVSHTITDTEKGSTVANVQGVIYSPDGTVSPPAPGAFTSDADNGEITVSFLFDTAGLTAAGAYAVALRFTLNGENRRVVIPITVLPDTARWQRWLARVLRWLGEADAPQIDPADVYDALSAAVREYQKDQPQIKASSIVADADVDEIDLPADWAPWSISLRVEHPEGTAKTAGQYIADRLRGKLRIDFDHDGTHAVVHRYTAPHVLNLDAGTDTIPDQDFDAVAEFTAAKCLYGLATGTIRTTDPRIAAAQVSYRDKAQQYTAAAKMHEAAARLAWGKLTLPQEDTPYIEYPGVWWER